VAISSHKKAWILIAVFLLILNPYTIFGNIGSFLSVFLALFLFIKWGHRFHRGYIIGAYGMVLILSSLWHEIPQIDHLKVSFSVLICILIGLGAFFYFEKKGLDFDDFIYFCLVAFAINSSIILLEVFFPVVRDLIEGFLKPSGNVDWTAGHRYRGLASGGAASLSLTYPVAVTLCLYLYMEKYISMARLFFFLPVLLLSLLFVGRTGVFLMPVVLLYFFVLNFRSGFLKSNSLIIFFMVFLMISLGGVKLLLTEIYGEWFYKYSLGFILDGLSGIDEEGTVSVIKNFLSVLPVAFPEVFVGYGFYGGSDFFPWTDSGYSRMFLSVGWLFGFLYYVIFIFMVCPAIKAKPFLFGTLTTILLVAEAKEPLIFSGYSARFYFISLAFLIMMQKTRNRSASITKFKSK